MAGSSIFKEWDADDRPISLIEFAQALRSMGLQPAEKQMQLMFRKIDPTASGFVDRQQLRGALKPWLEATRPPRRRQAKRTAMRSTRVARRGGPLWARWQTHGS